jgi:UDP-glucose 4-epimerase
VLDDTSSPKAMVAVLGASGFVGRAVVRSLGAHGARVVPVPAPRLQAHGTTPGDLLGQRDGHMIARLASQFEGCTHVVNAAGVASATGTDGRTLLGANALLPLLAAEASARAGARFLHISSAAVQGNTDLLDESSRHRPFSPYSYSKALGERLLDSSSSDHVRILRPTSVHGADRAVTRAVARLARSRASHFVAPGTQPTPQVHVLNVGAAAVACVLLDDLPQIVLQPSEGWTTASFMRVLGCGREPTRLPSSAGAVLKRMAVPALAASAGWRRRLEMLWLGQAQAPSSLDSRVELPAGLSDWTTLAREAAR